MNVKIPKRKRAKTLKIIAKIYRPLPNATSTFVVLCKLWRSNANEIQRSFWQNWWLGLPQLSKSLSVTFTLPFSFYGLPPCCTKRSSQLDRFCGKTTKLHFRGLTTTGMPWGPTFASHRPFWDDQSSSQFFLWTVKLFQFSFIRTTRSSVKSCFSLAPSWRSLNWIGALWSTKWGELCGPWFPWGTSLCSQQCRSTICIRGWSGWLLPSCVSALTPLSPNLFTTIDRERSSRYISICPRKTAQV